MQRQVPKTKPVSLLVYSLSIIISLIVSANEAPYIYISPNPSKVNIDLHSSNIDIISLGENNVNYSITDILKNRTSLSFSQSGGISSQNQLRMRGGEAASFTSIPSIKTRT